MSISKSHRRCKGSAFAITSAIIASACSADAFALTINQWTGNAGTTQWNNQGNWLNGNVPDNLEQATVYNGTIGLNGNPPSVGALLLANIGSPASLYTEGYKLNVLGTATIDGGTIVAQENLQGAFRCKLPI